MKKWKIIILLTLFIIVPLIALGIFRFRNLRFADYIPGVYSESARELDNPYIGWYQLYSYSLSDQGSCDTSMITELDYGPGLALLQFNLQDFADRPVNDAGLQQLKDILTAWHARGRQLIVRFLYDWDGNAPEQEPESLSLILEHMSQTADIINQHSDCIYILQGIFVGSWGEMHSSKYMKEEDMLTLIHHLAAVTDPRIFLAVRTPEQWRTIVQSANPLSSEEAFDGSLAARLSLFNDGMMGSETDLGTYAEADTFVLPSSFGKRSRQAELLFQEELCAYVPNGGEAVISNPYNDFPSAVQNLARTRVSYLNSAYDEDVLSKWKESACQGEAPFEGMNGYDYIARHLGYRYVLRSSDLTFSLPHDHTASLSLVLENVGFSGSYRSFDVCLILKHAKGRGEYVIPIQTDTRFWNPGLEVSLEATFPIQELPLGTYHIFLNISDSASGFPVLLANVEADAVNGGYVGSLTLRKLPQWNEIASTLIGEP